MDINEMEHNISDYERDKSDDSTYSDFVINSLQNEKHSDSSCITLPETELKFNELCQSLEDEEQRLRDLEDRRKKLEAEMENLQQEIEKEKILFRQAIDAEIAKKRCIEKNLQEVKEGKTSYQPKIDPLNVNREEIGLKLKEFREAIEESKMQPISSYQGDEEINKFKQNLVKYRNVLGDATKSKTIKQKRKVASKVFHKHLNEVSAKLSEELLKLSNYQKSLDTKESSEESNRKSETEE